VLGLGRQGIAEIPVDADGRIRLAELEAALEADALEGIVPVAVVAIAGVTDTGSVDPIADVAAIARRHRTWLHVDGAYGLSANASPRLRPLFAGVEEADSWIVDPHKWLATGLGVGATYVRDEELLTRAFAEGEAAYLEGAFSPDDVQATSQFDAMAGRWAARAWSSPRRPGACSCGPCSARSAARGSSTAWTASSPSPERSPRAPPRTPAWSC
jgi:aromatic-L-amino-acid decarboxylase